MSQQGDRFSGHQDDWWGQLYDDSTGDTGPAPASDTLDDRFASAAGTVGQDAARENGPREKNASRPSARPEARTPWEPPSALSPDPVAFPPTPKPPADPPGPPAVPSKPAADTPKQPAVPPQPAPGPTAPESPSPDAPSGMPSPDVPSDPPSPDVPSDTPPPDAPSGTPPPPPLPCTPPPVDYIGSGPPTYDPEPTALPPADPDHLADLVPDTALDGARFGSCTLRAVSARGDSARFRGEPRRDCLLSARFGTGDQALVLVAMATGRRGTPGAHRAAAEACHWIGRAVGRSHLRLGEDIRSARRGELKSGLQRLTDRSLGKLRAGAAAQGADPEEYTADLRCLLLPADPDCRIRVFFGVGAGGLFRLRDGEWQDIEPRAADTADTAGEPVVGFGSLPSETPEGDRLTMDLGITTPPSPYEPALEPPRSPFLFRASVARPGDTLLLCSAGLADPLRDEPELAEHLTARWSTGEVPGLTAFLADTLVRVKGYADDRTAAAVWEA
ncbi:protein phosphatase 2C domain-containing protein [Streptomyces cynarae]|uniref:Protein phosphatase 2C domain-containing protein n=1 Tax=Streptomyces cynarae TaxID=2981134 RepID=A0ABY6E7P5_9ACTN|nr:protein phosphatase 2C domain-containing protein [Streptomyces cynarae]UXY22657.1 protein phosphatase 2C domain-containing protein [Streptomyces cynarae]